MLSVKLVQLIETHWDEIARRLIVAIRKHPDMQSLANRPELEIREWCGVILENLGDMLSARNGEKMQRFQVLGKARFEENIPLHEAVLRFQLLKDKVFEFVHEQGYPVNAMQIYAEGELEHRVGRFFDACIYQVVCGYENALRRAARLAS